MKYVLLLSIALGSVSEAQWERVPEIPATSRVYSLLAAHDTLYVGSDSLVYVGFTSTGSWSGGTQPGPTIGGVAALAKVGNVILAGTFQRGVYKTTDDGISWQQFSSGLGGLGSLDIGGFIVRRDSLIASTFGQGVFITNADLTHSWSSWGDSIAEYQGENVYTMVAIGNTVLAGGGSNGYMFRYTDAEPWWNPIGINVPRLVGQNTSGAASSSNTVVSGTNTWIYRSTNEGRSWSKTSALIPAQTYATIALYHGSTFFALTTTPFSSTLQTSSDEGQTWESQGTFSLSNVFSMAIVGGTMYLGRQGGLWRAPLSQLLTSVEERETTPTAFTLRQNYPNPFNPSTTIEFTLPENGRATLKIYTLMGQEVATLVDEEVTTGTLRRAMFDASRLPTGLYFARLKFGDIAITRKLLFVK